jgi:hypothetical protein
MSMKRSKASEVRELFDTGLSYAEIARRTGVKYQHVRNIRFAGYAWNHLVQDPGVPGESNDFTVLEPESKSGLQDERQPSWWTPW